MKRCTRCINVRDDGEDNRFDYIRGSEHGVAGGIAYFQTCNLNREQVPEQFEDCPLVIQAMSVLPAMCHECESLQYCHFPEDGELIITVNRGHLAACHRERYAELFSSVKAS